MKLFIDEIKRRWKRIDYLFCGLGGAGYFPNTVHHESKDDAETGKLREQFLAHNFCKLMNGLQPMRVIPFLPGFALLATDKRWINEIKFPREKLKEYFCSYFDHDSKIEWLNLFPGDWIENGEQKKNSPYHDLAVNGDVSHLVEEQYADEIKSFNAVPNITEHECKALFKLVADNIPDASRVFHNEVLEHLCFSIKISNAAGKNILNVRYMNPHWKFEASDEVAVNSHLLIRVPSHVLHYSLATPWGGDILMVGYGADIDVLNEIALRENHDIICLRLLTRIPVASDYLAKEPLRMMKFMATNPVNTMLSIKQKITARGNPNRIPYNERNHWINKTPCEICRACNIPLLSYEYGEMLNEEPIEITTSW
jgi:hypothetical protein